MMFHRNVSFWVVLSQGPCETKESTGVFFSSKMCFVFVISTGGVFLQKIPPILTPKLWLNFCFFMVIYAWDQIRLKKTHRRNKHVAILCGLSDPFQRLSDLQLGDQKVTA